MIRSFARSYAKAIYEVAASVETADTTRRELARFEEARKLAPELPEVLRNPSVDIADRLAIVRSIAERLQLSDLTMRVLDVLVRNHRVNDLAFILEALQAMIHSAMGIVRADVRSARGLSEDEQQRLRGALEQKFGQKIELEVETDPSLLGGFVAKVGSEVFDASVLGQIHKFREQLA
ncbi:MAG: ATP synthase F1 subunit delta [Thermoanaerobaculia bacterium]